MPPAPPAGLFGRAFALARYRDDVATTEGAPVEWITVADAARWLSMSRAGFRVLAHREGVEVRQRGRLPGVRRADLDAFVERSRIRPQLEETLTRRAMRRTAGL